MAIESSATRASVALGRAGRVVFAAEADAGNRQSQVLIGPLREALTRAADGRIELVIVGTGPGSYNGARVGIAMGQGVALVHGCPAVGVCSLEALAPVRAGDRCLALGDARRGSFFSLEIHDGGLSGAPHLMAFAEFQSVAKAGISEGAILLTLEDPRRLKLPEDVTRHVRHVAPDASLLLAAWRSKAEDEQGRLLSLPPEPFYLRAPHITKPVD